jgi:hypothetical protein
MHTLGDTRGKTLSRAIFEVDSASIKGKIKAIKVNFMALIKVINGALRCSLRLMLLPNPMT